jgi:hypothetical protein
LVDGWLQGAFTFLLGMVREKDEPIFKKKGHPAALLHGLRKEMILL